MSDDSSNSSQQAEGEKTAIAGGILEALFIPMVCVVGASLLLGIGFGVSGLDYANLTEEGTLWLAAASVILPALLLAVYVRYVKNLSLSAFGLRLPGTKDWLELAKSFGWYMILSFSLLILAQALFSGFDPAEEQDLGLAVPDSANRLVLMFAILTVLTPVAEELLFRGFMFPGLRLRWGWLPAAIVSAVLFGVLHAQVNVAIDTAAMGFISARLMQRTGSLTPSILLHSVKNTIAFTLVFVWPLVS